MTRLKHSDIDKKTADMNIDNLRRHYFRIKRQTNELLEKYSDNSFVRDPSVDIRTIAFENGVVDIIPVPPKDVAYEHATLEDGVLRLNKRDSLKERNFSIAHDVKHLIDEKTNSLIDAHGKKKKSIGLYPIRASIKLPDVGEKRSKMRARSSKNSRLKFMGFKLEGAFRLASKYIVREVASYLGKDVSVAKARDTLKKMFLQYLDSEKGDNRPPIIDETIAKLYNEEIADYFAANLLVPTDRFFLWEDKPDREIAKAFKVPVKCIKKRRKEIKFEIDFTTIKNLSSGD